MNIRFLLSPLTLLTFLPFSLHGMREDRSDHYRLMEDVAESNPPKKLFKEEQDAIDTHMLASTISGDMEQVRFWIARGANPLQARSYHKKTGLHWAVEYSRVECARFFIECGVDVNSQDDKGFTPMHRAVHATYVRQGIFPQLATIAELLVEAGADLDHIKDTPFKDTVLEACARARRANIIMKCDMHDINALSSAIERGKLAREQRERQRQAAQAQTSGAGPSSAVGSAQKSQANTKACVVQ